MRFMKDYQKQVTLTWDSIDTQLYIFGIGSLTVPFSYTTDVSLTEAATFEYDLPWRIDTEDLNEFAIYSYGFDSDLDQSVFKITIDLSDEDSDIWLEEEGSYEYAISVDYSGYVVIQDQVNFQVEFVCCHCDREFYVTDADGV